MWRRAQGERASLGCPGTPGKPRKRSEGGDRERLEEDDLRLLRRELWPGRVGNIGGIIAASLFIVFPSALNWYGQLHKDGYTITGVLLILLSWVWALDRKPSLKTGIWLIVGTTAGMLLVVFVKPYYLTLLFCAGLMLFVLLIFYIFCN